MWTRVRDFLKRRSVLRAIASLRRASANLTTVEQAVSLAFEFCCGKIRTAPAQIRSEITQLLRVLAPNPPTRILEIGTANGGTFFLFSRIATEDGLLISADLPLGPFGGGYPKRLGEFFQSFARERQQVHLLAFDSHSPDTLCKVKELLAGSLLDFLFIDGDHRYEGVKADYQMYSPLVRPGGLICFHDIVPGPAECVGGVPIFWQEIKKQHRVQEFVADWNQGGYGIGLVVKET
jgi:predicted O-methyltransferase YrrM